MPLPVLLFLSVVSVAVAPREASAQVYCPGMCFDCFSIQLQQDGHRYDYFGTDDVGLLPHQCGGWPTCLLDHPPCWEGLQAVLPMALPKPTVR